MAQAFMINDGIRCNRITVALLTAGILAVLPGCRGETKPKLVPVKGTVIFRDKPLANAQVSFFAKGASLPGIGKTNDAGEFQLSVIAGDSKITVVVPDSESNMTTPDPSKIAKGEAVQYPGMNEGDKKKTTSTPLPKVYSDMLNTPLNWTVKPEGDLNVKLELK